MDKNKNLTIHKQNLIIRGKFGEFTVDTMRCLNAIYYGLQKELKKDNVNANNGHITFKMSSLRKYMNLEKNNDYVDIIRKSLRQLQEPFDIPNYTDVDGKVWKWYCMSLLIKSKTPKENEITVNIQVDEEMISLIKNKSEWTELEFNNVQHFSSKYAMRTYEYAKSYANMKKTPPLDLDNLNSLFGTKYTYLSDVEKILKRAIKDINKTDIYIDYDKDKKLKTITLKITKNENKEKQKIAIKIKKSLYKEMNGDEDIMNDILEKINK